jgi:hypothetical protein
MVALVKQVLLVVTAERVVKAKKAKMVARAAPVVMACLAEKDWTAAQE